MYDYIQELKHVDLNQEFIKILLLKYKGSSKTAKKDFGRIDQGELNDFQYITEVFLSPEALKQTLKKSADIHLYYIHSARLKLVASLLPPASRILDLGGANGSIYNMGYPHKFKKITIVDLPPADRIDMYKSLKMKAEKTTNGIIDTHYGSMTNLKFTKDNSIDMVWSGESIEHISVDDGKIMLKEAFRVLRPGGSLCLDTPNGIITSIQVRDAGVKFIHPEHKIEYTPRQLQKMLKKAGFKIIVSRGICEMKNTIKNNRIDYTDFILGNSLTENINTAYMQYYQCIKPEPLKHRLKRRAPARLMLRVKGYLLK